MSVDYALGVDIGSAFAKAAVARHVSGDGDTVVASAPLSEDRGAMPAAVFVEPDGSLILGDAAIVAGRAAPHRLVVDLPRAVGSDLPLVVAGHHLTPEALLTRLIQHAVAEVTQAQGAPPAQVGVAVPAGWGEHRIGLLVDALSEGELTAVTVVSAAIAAATDHAAVNPLSENSQRWAMVDLGATSLTCAVIGREPDNSVALAADPSTLDDSAGHAIDDVVIGHVVSGIDSAALASADPARLVELRGDCVSAKEQLSDRPQTVMDVAGLLMPTTLRITRSEFDALVDPLIDRYVATFLDTVDGIGALDEVVLVGGSSQIPRVSQKVSEACARPVTLALDPESAVARGAARAALATLAVTPASVGNPEDAAASPPLPLPTPRRFRPGDLPSRARWALVGVVGGFAAVSLTIATTLALGVSPASAPATGTGVDAPAGTVPLQFPPFSPEDLAAALQNGPLGADADTATSPSGLEERAAVQSDPSTSTSSPAAAPGASTSAPPSPSAATMTKPSASATTTTTKPTKTPTSTATTTAPDPVPTAPDPGPTTSDPAPDPDPTSTAPEPTPPAPEPQPTPTNEAPAPSPDPAEVTVTPEATVSAAA